MLEAPDDPAPLNDPAPLDDPNPVDDPTGEGPATGGRRPTARRLLLAALPALRTGLTAALLILLTLCLELKGIRWGLPSAQNYDSFHPDEWTVIEAAQRVAPFAGHLSPGFFNYGSLYIYALSAAFSFCQAVGILDAHPLPGALDPDNKALLYLTARCVTVAFSTGTVLLTWRLGCRLFGKATGTAAGTLLALTPLFAIYSHYAIVDVAASFWMVLAGVLCARILTRVKIAAPVDPRTGGPARMQVAAPLIGSALAAGLAAGTKYNAGVALFAALLGWKWQLSDGRRRSFLPGDRQDDRGTTPPDGNSARAKRHGGAFHFWGDLVYGWLLLTLAAGGAFLISTPGFLIDRPTFLKDFLFELRHVGAGHGFIFSDTPIGFIHHIRYSLWMGAGPPLCLLFLAGALYAGVRTDRADLMLAAMVVPYYLVIGLAQVKFMRYVIPMLPLLAIWAARLWLAGFRRGPEQPAAPNGMQAPIPRSLARALLLAAGVIASGGALAETVAYNRILAAPPVQIQAEDWIVDHVPAHASVGLIQPPWFDGPPIVPYNDIRITPGWLDARQNELPYRVEITGWDPVKLAKERPQYYVLTEWQVRYRLRIHQLEPDGQNGTALAGRQSAAFLRVIAHDYRLLAAFSQPAALGPLRFSAVPPDPARGPRGADDTAWRQWIPDDWLIPNPTIWLYVRKDQPAV
ncbi:MAG: hypothetical protein LC772_01265 [Chloroflexi bacterium]|nr:hypothetical protein [Chloroflexota bacterium]